MSSSQADPAVSTDKSQSNDNKASFNSYREFLYTNFYNSNQKAFLNFYESVRSSEPELSGPASSDKPSLDVMIRFLRRTSVHNTLSIFNLHRRIAHFSFSSLPKISLDSSASSASTLTSNGAYASGMRFDYSPEAIGLCADELIAIEKSVLDHIAAIDVENVENVENGENKDSISVENVLFPLIKVDQQLSGTSNAITFLMNVHPDSAVRDASAEAEKKLAKFGVDCGMREDVYKVLKALKQKIENGKDEACLKAMKQADRTEEIVDENGNKKVVVQNEWMRYLDKNLQDFERNGLDLQDEAKKSKLKEIKKRMAECSSTFMKNLNEEKSEWFLTKSELEGMDEDYLSERLDAASGKYKVTLKYPCVVPLMQKCRNWQTRKLFDQRFNSRCKEANAPLMEELVLLRCQQSKLLNKTSHAEHVLDIRMAKRPDVVSKFLTELSEKMAPKAKDELAQLKKYKAREMEAIGKDGNLKKNIGIDANKEIMSYDFRYYLNIYEKDALKVDQDQLKRYFPVRKVVEGALEIYQDMLGLTFELVAGKLEGGDEAQEAKQNENLAEEKGVQWKLWHDSVKLFRVRDKFTNELVGHFFLDLYPRQGKYGHACMCTLEPGCLVYEMDDKTGEIMFDATSKQLPVNAMLCNFPDPSTSPNPYLTHSDVVTFFHEFGHVMHQILGQTQLVRFSGTRVERDFVEAPSQMLENWCWYEKPLLRMSQLPSDRTLDQFKELIVKLKQSKDAMPGLLTKRQLYFGLLDQDMHSIESEEVAKAYDTQSSSHQKQREIWGIPDWTSVEAEAKDKSNFVASFGHLAGGYDSQYYGYMWSEVYSADMFHSKFYESVAGNANDSNKAGLEYRKHILEAGASRDAIDSLRTFLGREPNDKAFLKEKGVGNSKL